MSLFSGSRQFTRILPVLSIVCLSVLATVARGAEPWPSTGLNTSAADQKIRDAMENDTRVDFIETPLDQVVAFLMDQHDINIQLDTIALDSYGIGTDVPFTNTIKGLSLKSALNVMLRQLKLTYVIEDEVLMITTVEAARLRPELRVYNVARLLGDDMDASTLAATLYQTLMPLDGPNFIAPGGMGVGMGGMGGGGFFSVQDEGGYEEDYGGGGYGEMGSIPATPATPVPLPRIIPHGKLLIVRHTSNGQDDVARLLGAIAAALEQEQ